MRLKHVFILGAIALIIVISVMWVAVGFNLGSYKVDPLVSNLKLGLDIEGGVIVTYEVISDATGSELTQLVQQTKRVLANRINEMGLTEPNVYVEGERRIQIELPGVSNAEEAIAMVGKTAQLKFSRVLPGNIAQEGDKYDSTKMVDVLTGEDVLDAGLSKDEYGKPAVGLKFNAEGTKLFSDATSLLYSQNGGQIAILLDDVVISAPRVAVVINDGNAIISGSFTSEEATNLALLIRGGALPASLKQIQYNAIGPTLGRNALNSSIKAAIAGFILVIAFMILYYRLPGLVASISLILYSCIILILMVALGATLTLPGVAGIVLSVGMAVDANVIIFERIKEELREGKTLKASLGHGFAKALSTILDSNVTTIIAAIVLFQFGEGAIKGFAVTLMLGIITSMFTAIVITKTIMMQLSHTRTLTNKKLYGA